MQTVARTSFGTVKSEGAILPPDLLQRIADQHLPGLNPDDYHLFPGEKLNEAINRAWNRCLGAWASFQERQQRLPADDFGTSLTRERWLLILFQELGYGRLQTARSITIDDHDSYPISHLWNHTPIHLVSFKQELDRRSDIPGATRRSPHSLVQELLNRTDAHLWAFLSNGLRLRILRNNVSLTRLAYVEFDLDAMFSGEMYADFSLLWLLCHQSRVESERPAGCWLEKWSQEAAASGTRALDVLRDGVQETIAILGRGFLAHRANRSTLHRDLKAGTLSTQDYYRQLLRLVYRLIFLFVAEDRDLLLLPDTPDNTRDNYFAYYAARRFREQANAVRGGPHTDLYHQLQLLLSLFQDGYSPLGLPALGSFLFSEAATPALNKLALSNRFLLDAIRALAFVRESNVRRPVDYRNLGAEELGSIYESLLELHPQLNTDAATFTLVTASGSERKTTGSYYTPTSLINSLLDTALEPVVEARLKQADSTRQAHEEAILSIKVVDPACGSGHFLIAAANRLARHLARSRTGDVEPGPDAQRRALREVVRRCIHGVDSNEMSVELCKVALWMETLDPGKPLSFLEANILCGNSLLGATPALLNDGIPDAAFTPITGDDKKYCTEFKKLNKKQRGQFSMFDIALQPWDRLGNLAASMTRLHEARDDTLAEVQQQQADYEALVRSSAYQYGQLWADAWCAAFVWPKNRTFAYPITEEVFRNIERTPYNLPAWMRDEIQRLREQYQFLHWHLAFPHVFRPADTDPDHALIGWRGGFDVVLGNPPWERIKIQEKEFFSTRHSEIASAANAAARKKAIAALQQDDPDLWTAYQTALRHSEAESHFLRQSGRYPLTGRGDVNTYQVFAELARHLPAPEGRAGIIVPTGIATDYTNRDFFAALVDTYQLASLFDFENRQAIFPGVHRSYKFSLLTLRGPVDTAAPANFAFFLLDAAELDDPAKTFSLTAEDFARINPNTKTCPIFRSRRDADLTRQLYQAAPILINDATGMNPWGVSFLRMFDMSNDSDKFRTRAQLEAEGFRLAGNRFERGAAVYLPLYEAKLMHQFDHRYATYTDDTTTRDITPEEHHQPDYLPLPRYWVAKQSVDARIPDYKRLWLMGWRDITGSNNERTFISAFYPRAAAGDTFLQIFSEKSVLEIVLLEASLNSLAFDFVTRQKISGTHLKYYVVKQLPVHPPARYNGALLGYIVPRVLELTYTAWDMRPFADEVWREAGVSLREGIAAQWQANQVVTGGHASRGAEAPGWAGGTGEFPHPPFKWDAGRRFQLRCELDALYFHLYGVARDDVAYILDTFPIVKRKDEAQFGEYRTQRVILDTYDALHAAGELIGSTGGG